MIRKLTSLTALVVCGLATHCAAEPVADDGEGATSSALSSRIHDTYGVTMFGGAGDFQKMACGLSSRAAQQSNPYYVASSQRYGCKVHLKLTTRAGTCVVVSTEDAGPATWVETKAGTPILDASPAAVKKLFPGAGSIGWSDLRKNPGKYEVTATRTSLPLGPCSGGSAPVPAPAPSSAPAPPDDEPSPAPPGGGGGGVACSGDGACNPGNDGSGQICEDGQCVDGCRTNAQCPGATSCVAGQCR
jgi:hypothetical protein